MYRYWTGSAWTESITPDPLGTPAPVAGGGPGAGPAATPQPPYGSYQASGAPGGSRPTTYPPSGSRGSQSSAGYGGTPPARRRGTGWWVAGGVALLALVVAVVLIVRGMGVNVPGIPDLPGTNPTATSSPDICPPASDSSALPTTSPESGWISGGKLSFPAMDGEWQTQYDNRVPWGSLAQEQIVVVQSDYDGTSGHDWVASVLVSDLFVGDGFASTKVAAETVLKCVLGIYYSDTNVTEKPVSSAQHNVDGHSGWLIETQLSFDIQGLETKGERVLLLVVQTGDSSYGLFYASIPDTRSDLLPDARDALSNLRVG
jgi:hypothetical protein